MATSDRSNTETPLPVHKEKYTPSSTWLGRRIDRENDDARQEKPLPLVSDVLYEVIKEPNPFDGARWIDEDILDEEEGRSKGLRRYARVFLAKVWVQAFIFFIVTVDLYLCIHFMFIVDDSDKHPIFSFLNIGILSFLGLEILVRIIAHGYKFFASKLNVFEMLIVIVCIVLQAVEVGFSATWGRTLRPVVQVSRVLRRGMRVPVYVEQMRRRFDKIVDSMVDRQIKHMLGDWVHLPADNVESHITRGHFRLEKVHILPEKFMKIHSPFTLRGGFVELLDVDMNLVPPLGLQVLYGKQNGIQIHARNCHLVFGSNLQYATGKPDPSYEEVLQGKDTVVEFLTRPVDMLAIKAAQAASQKFRERRRAHKRRQIKMKVDASRSMKAVQRSRTAAEKSRKPIPEDARLDALESGMATDSTGGASNDEDSDSDDEGEHEKGGVSLSKDVSRIFDGMSETMRATTTQATANVSAQAQIAHHRLVDALKHPGDALQELREKILGRFKKHAQTAVLSQVQSLNLSFKNISLRYEDTDPQHACANGGVKVADVRLRIERNAEKLLKETSDFRAKMSWDACRGVATGFFPDAAREHNHARVALQIDRLSAWWDPIELSQMITTQTQDSTRRMNSRLRIAKSQPSTRSERDPHATHLVDCLTEPAVAAREYKIEEVHERLKVSWIRAGATAQEEHFVRRRDGLPPGPCSLSQDERPHHSVIRQPRSERQCRWLPHSYLLVPMSASLHAAILLESDKDIAVQKETPESSCIADTDPRKIPQARKRSSYTAFVTSYTSKKTEDLAPDFDSTGSRTSDPIPNPIPHIDVDIQIEDVILRIDRGQLTSLGRLNMYSRQWMRQNELIQWRPIARPVTDTGFLSKDVSGHLRAHPMSPLRENITASWWRFATVKVLRSVLPFNNKIPSKVVTLLDMKRRGRLQIYLFLMYMKYFDNLKIDTNSTQARVKEMISLASRCGAKAEKIQDEEPESRLPKVFKGILRAPWEQTRDFRCIQELQVALPFMVIMECRYSAERIVTQRILDGDIKKHEHHGTKAPASHHLTATNEIPNAVKFGNERSREIHESQQPKFQIPMQVRYELKRFLWVVLEAPKLDNQPRPVNNACVAAQSHRPRPLDFLKPFKRRKQGRTKTKRRAPMDSGSGSNIVGSNTTTNNVHNHVSNNNSNSSHGVTSSTARNYWHNYMTRWGSNPRMNVQTEHSKYTNASSWKSDIEPPRCRKLFTQNRMNNFSMLVCKAGPADVRKALVPRVFENADKSGLSVRIGVGTYHFTWCKAPPGASSLRPIFCFYPGGGDGTDNRLEVHRYAFVIQMAKQDNSEDTRSAVQDRINRLKCEVPESSEDSNKEEKDRRKQSHAEKQKRLKIKNLECSMKALQEPQEMWRMHVKSCPFKAIYNYPVVTELKNMMLLAAPPHQPPFEPDPLGLKYRRWILEVKERETGEVTRRDWVTRFRLASGAEKRTGLAAAYWDMRFDWDDDTHIVRVRDLMHQKMLVIEHVDLPPQKNKVVRWPVGGSFTWAAFWPPDWQPQATEERLTVGLKAMQASKLPPMPTPVDHEDVAFILPQEAEIAKETTQMTSGSTSTPTLWCCHSMPPSLRTTQQRCCPSPATNVTAVSDDVVLERSRVARLPDDDFLASPKVPPALTAVKSGMRSVPSTPIESFASPDPRAFIAKIFVVSYTRNGKYQYEEVDKCLNFHDRARKAANKRKEHFSAAIKASKEREHDDIGENKAAL